MDFSVFTQSAAWTGLIALTAMEIVLGVDNIIFVSILVSSVKPEQQKQARLIGLGLACTLRLGLLMLVGQIIKLSEPFTKVFGHPLSWRDVIIVSGGVFLVYKATREIYEKMEVAGHDSQAAKPIGSLSSAILQIALLNIIFSLDSIITAIGMTEYVEVMMLAVILSLGFIIWVGKPVGDFVAKHPSVKMLALAFLLLIGVSLTAEAFHKEIPKGYVYSAMAFSTFVEALNFFVRKRQHKKSAVSKQ